MKLVRPRLAFAGVLLGAAFSGGCGGCGDSRGGERQAAPTATPVAVDIVDSGLRMPAPEDGDLVSAAAHAWNGGAPAVTEFERERLCPGGTCMIVRASDIGAAQSPGHLTFVGHGDGGDFFLSPYGMFRLGTDGHARFGGASFGVGARAFLAEKFLIVDAPQWRAVRVVDAATLEVRASYTRGRALRGADDFAVGTLTNAGSAPAPFAVYLQEPEAPLTTPERGIAFLALGASIELRAPSGTTSPWLPMPLPARSSPPGEAPDRRTSSQPPANVRGSVTVEAGVDRLVVRDSEQVALYGATSPVPVRVWTRPTGAESTATPSFLLTKNPAVAEIAGGEVRIVALTEAGVAPDAIAHAPIPAGGVTALFALRAESPLGDAPFALVATPTGARLLDGRGLSAVFGRTSEPVDAKLLLAGQAIFVRYRDGVGALYLRGEPMKKLYEGHDERPDVDRDGNVYLYDSNKSAILRFPVSRPTTSTSRPANHSESDGATPIDAQIAPPARFAGCSIRDFPLPADVCALFPAH